MLGSSPRLSGLIPCTKNPAWTLLTSSESSRHRTGKSPPMQHRNTVLHRLLSGIRSHRFEAHAERHASDKHVRTLTTKTQFIAMAYGQLSGSDSLRETVTRFNSQGPSLYHLGAKPVAKST